MLDVPVDVEHHDVFNTHIKDLNPGHIIWLLKNKFRHMNICISNQHFTMQKVQFSIIVSSPNLLPIHL